MTNFATNFAGYGAVVADSIAIAGAASVGGTLTTAAVSVANGNLTMGTNRKLILDTATTLSSCALQFNGDPNTGLIRDSADFVKFVAGGTYIAAYAPAAVGGNDTFYVPTNFQCLGTSAFTGAVTTGALNVSNGNLTMGTGRKLILDTNTSTSDLALQYNGDPNTGMYRSAVDTQAWVAGGSAALFTLGANVLTNGYIYINEATAPSALANHSILYSLDVGGKTQLTAKQGSAGTVVALAIEV